MNELANLPLDPDELSAGARESRTMFHPKPIQFAHVLAAEILEQVPTHQLVAERHEHPLLHLLAADGQTVRAGATGSRAKAREAIPPIHHVPAAALSTFRQAGEEVLRAPRLVESLRIAARRHTAHLDLPRLHLIPEFVVDDSQVGNGGRHPLGWCVRTGNALPGIRILDVAQTIPYEPPDIQLVVQDSGASCGIAVNGAGIPGCATRSWTAFYVQLLRERLRRHASGIVAEDPADHVRFSGNDLSIACRRCTIVGRSRHLVAVAEAASGLPELHSAAQASTRLVSEILQEERVHRALQSDMQVRDIPFRERDDVHAGEGEAFEESGGIFLVTAESIECFGDHNVESLVQRIPH